MRAKLEAEQKKRKMALNKGIFKHQLHNADEFTKQQLRYVELCQKDVKRRIGNEKREARLHQKI